MVVLQKLLWYLMPRGKTSGRSIWTCGCSVLKNVVQVLCYLKSGRHIMHSEAFLGLLFLPHIVFNQSPIFITAFCIKLNHTSLQDVTEEQWGGMGDGIYSSYSVRIRSLSVTFSPIEPLVTIQII